MPVNLTINKMVTEYDHIMIVGPVFPHEVVGFSGGNKYLFPGIAGQEIIDFFHWLGAIITNPKIIGTKYTPVREVVDVAASYVTAENEAASRWWLKAAILRECITARLKMRGAKLRIYRPSCISLYSDRTYHTVLSCAPEMYDDIWTGGKCMYKLEPVIAEGGKLIIYAPHIDEISYTHGQDHRRDRLSHAGLLHEAVGQVQALSLGSGRAFHARQRHRQV